MPMDPVNGLLDNLSNRLNAQPHEDAVSMGLGDLLRKMFSASPKNLTLPNESGRTDPRIAGLDPVQVLARLAGGK